MGIVYFLRHGESQANAHGICAGQLNSPLTMAGKHQAAVAAQFIVAQGLQFDVILCSPIDRTRATAGIIASAIGYKHQPVYLDDLKERYCGDFQGHPTAKYYAADEILSAKEMHVESIPDLNKRAKRVKAYIAAHYPGKKVLIISHSGFGKMLRLVFGDEPVMHYHKADQLPNATLMRLV